MKRIRFYNILIALSLANTLIGFGQTNDKTKTLTGDYTNLGIDLVEARDWVKLDNTFSFTAATDKTITIRANESLVCDADYLIGDDIIINDDRDILTTLDVGATPGTFSVNSNGGANYSVPIFTPPGIKGIQPNVSIVYNSFSSSGILGVGWGLSAISSISRVPRDYAHDGETEGIELSFDDKFVIDGNRLILKGGNYGEAGSTYETEFKNFSTITAIGETGNGPTSFQVTTVSGTTLLYGDVTESRNEIGSPSTAYIWRLTKVTDANNNYMEYIYKQTENGETYLETIKYTGNTSTGIDPLNEMQFFYEEKSDKNFYYLRGNKLENELLLRRVRVKVDEETYRVYDFEYITSNNSTFLNKVTEKNKNDQQLNATTINWNALPSNLSTKNSSMDLTKYKGDFNGDGLTDYIRDVTNSVFRVYYNDGDGTFTDELAFTLNSAYEFVGALVGDFNGNGRDDVITVEIQRYCTWRKTGETEDEICEEYIFKFYENENGTFTKRDQRETENCLNLCGDPNASGTGELKNEFRNQLYTGDFNGDGYEDAFIFNFVFLGAPNFTSISTISGFNHEQFNYVLDYNGDGKSNLMTCDNEGWISMWEYNASIFERKKVFKFEGDEELTKGSNIFIGDFNGDGSSDILYYQVHDYNWRICYSKGDDYTFENLPGPIATNIDPSVDDDNYLYFVGDVDGNGKDDIVELYYESSNRYAKVYYSHGDNSFTNQTYDLGDELFSNEKTTLANLTDDGQLDLIIKDNGTIYSFNENNYSYKVKSIMDGTGIRTDINYGRLTDVNDDFYIKSSSESFPLNVLTVPFSVVTSYTQTSTLHDANIEFNNISLYYEDAVFHRRGFGFLGFKKVTRTNINGNKTINEFKFDQPQYSPYLANSKSYYKNTLLGESSTTMGYKEFTLLNGKKNYFLHANTTSVTDALNGNTTTSVNDYDANANLTSRKTMAEDGSYTEILPSDYLANGSYKPGTITTKKKHADDSQVFISITKSTYGNNDNLIQVIENFNKTTQITTDYTESEINSYGYPTEIVQTPVGLNEIITTLDYDDTHRFIASKTITGVGTETFTYDDIGNILMSTDIYNNTATNTYDDWGKLTSSTDAFGDTSSIALSWSTTSDPTGTIFKSESTSPNAPASINYIDYAGRTIKTKSEGFNGIYYYTDAEFNDRNLISSQTNLYQEGGTQRWNTYTYRTTTDGRLQNIAFSSGANIGYTYETNKVTKAVNSKNYVTEYDVSGTVSKVTNPLGSTVEYDYYSSGVVSQTTTSGGILTNTVDANGFITGSTDPMLGSSSSQYNAQGAVTYSKDGNGNEFDYEYNDSYNRLTGITNRDDASENYTLSYVSSGNGKGQLQSKTYTDGSLNTGLSYTYYPNGQLYTETKTIGSKTFTNTYAYHDDGKLWKIDNSEGKTYEYIYNTKGFLTNIKYGSKTVWTLQSQSLTTTQEKLGSGITLTSVFDEYGNPVSTKAGALIDFTYDFNDATGNLTSRTQVVDGATLTESFGYDELDRLTNITGDGAGTDVAYDNTVKENIYSKSDAGGSYEYDASAKYQLSKIQDPSSALGSLPTQAITYTSFNKVKQIVEGSDTITFWYGPNQERCKMEVKQNGSELYTKYYFGDYEIKEQGGSVIEKIFYLTSPNGIIGFNRVKTSPAEDNIYYTLKDYLGSILVVTNEAGTSKLEEYSYDAWGRRRNPGDWTYNNVTMPTYCSRGFTAHEHIDEVGLINMNGRVYDPLIGLFMSPDPVLPDPFNPLSYNKYSYVLNNPLVFTDPSGDFPWLAAGIIAGFLYLKGAHDNATETNQGNPLHWQWNPTKWNKNNTDIIVGVSGNSDGSFTAFGGINIGNNGTVFGYNNIHGWGFGNTNNSGFTDFYFSSINYNAPEENTLKSIDSYRAAEANFQQFREDYWAARTSMVAEPYVNITFNPASNEIGTEWQFYLGTLAAITSELYYSDKFGIWMGKNFKIYSQTWGGNRFAGGKNKFGKKTSNAVKWGGHALGVYNAFSIHQNYKAGKMTQDWMYIEQLNNAVSTFGGTYGAAWGVGWEIGRTITKTNIYQEIKFNFWYSQMEKRIGAPNQFNENLWYDFFKNYNP